MPIMDSGSAALLSAKGGDGLGESLHRDRPVLGKGADQKTVDRGQQREKHGFRPSSIGSRGDDHAGARDAKVGETQRLERVFRPALEPGIEDR